MGSDFEILIIYSAPFVFPYLPCLADSAGFLYVFDTTTPIFADLSLNGFLFCEICLKCYCPWDGGLICQSYNEVGACNTKYIVLLAAGRKALGILIKHVEITGRGIEARSWFSILLRFRPKYDMDLRGVHIKLRGW
jgi:hypothetical protein